MSKTVVCIKVEPVMRRIAKIALKPSIQSVRRILGAADFGHRVILDAVGDDALAPGEMLMLAARVNVRRDHPFKEWRFRGGENTVGIGLLFGTYERNKGGPGMWHCPVDIEWVERNIIWCEPGEDAPAAEVAEFMRIPHVQAEKAEGSQLATEETAGGPAAGADGEGKASDLAPDEG